MTLLKLNTLEKIATGVAVGALVTLFLGAVKLMVLAGLVAAGSFAWRTYRAVDKNA